MTPRGSLAPQKRPAATAPQEPSAVTKGAALKPAELLEDEGARNRAALVISAAAPTPKPTNAPVRNVLASETKSEWRSMSDCEQPTLSGQMAFASSFFDLYLKAR